MAINIGMITSIVDGIITAKIENAGKYVDIDGEKKLIGEVGSYVMVEEATRLVILEITGIRNTNEGVLATLGVLGEIADKRFTFGATRMPRIFSNIAMVNQIIYKVINTIGPDMVRISNTNNTRLQSLVIGKSVMYDLDTKINIDRFFGFHSAILGNTGAGKSNTIARIIQNIFLKIDFAARGAKFVVVDSNGEYETAFSHIGDTNSNLKTVTVTADPTDTAHSHIEIPVWSLQADDWAILLNASERNQIPVLERAIQIAKVFYSSPEQTGKIRNHILATTISGIINSSDNSPSKIDKLTAILTKFKTKDIFLDREITSSLGMKQTIRVSIRNDNGQLKDVEAVQNFCDSQLIPNIGQLLTMERDAKYDMKDFAAALELATLYEGSVSSTRIQEYTATLSSRINQMKDGEMGKIFVKTNYASTDKYIEALLANNQILNIDVSGVDDNTSDVIVKVFSKLLLDYLRKRPQKADMPINLLIEEAHRYVKNEKDNVLGYNIFERIAKEGRKYGLLLMVSTQRPSELSKTVISQCANFIIHRIQNPDDLAYIKAMVPSLSNDTINRLTYIPTGTALVFGTAINLPTLTKFDIADPQTDGTNAKISKKWFY